MRLILLLALPLFALPLFAAERDGNRFTIPENGGGITIEFATPVSFQYERWWGAKPMTAAPLSPDSLTITIKENPDGTLQLKTRFLDVTLAVGGSMSVKTTTGKGVLSMPRAMTREGFVLQTDQDEMFYGLGAIDVPKLNLRGIRTKAPKPFLISSHGYGLFIPNRPATFDLSAQLAIDTTVFQFYYGPNPKEILEQHAITTHTQIDIEEATLATRDEKKLPKDIRGAM